MAHTMKNGVIVVDGTGIINVASYPLKVMGIEYVANDDTWLASITAGDGGQSLFRCDSDIANMRSFYKYYGGIHVTEMHCATFTDMDEIIIYTQDVGK